MGLLRGRPLTGESLRLRAEREIARGDRPAALLALEAAVAAEPEEAENHLRLGVLLMSCGRFEAARRALTVALVLDSSCHPAKRALDRLPARLPPTAGFAVGETVAGVIVDYRVTEIRTGGFSAVYLADCEADGLTARVALKTVAPAASHFAADRSRVLNEAAAWLQLPPHEHIVTAHLFDYVDGLPCLVLEQVVGQDLGAVLSAAVPPMPVGIGYAVQICDAMTFLSDHGMSHGDLTPANCLVDPAGRVQLTDFGAAAAAREADFLNGALGMLRPETLRRYVIQPGTAPYIPPEWLDAGKRSVRGDLYSFGVLLFALLGGRPEDAQGAVRSGSVDWLPPQLVELIRQCTERTARRRPRSFAAVRAELVKLPFVRPAAPSREVPQLVRSQYEVESAFHQIRGMALLQLQELRAANRSIAAALRTNPGSSVSWALKANLHRALRQHTAASQAAGEAVRLADGSAQDALAAGHVLLRTGDADFQRAVTALAPALDSTEYAGQAGTMLCLAAAEAGAWSDSLAWADRALRHRVNDRHLLLAVKALAHYFSGRRQEALELATEVSERRPHITLAWAVLSLAHHDAGEPAAADAAMARLREASGSDTAATRALAGRAAEVRGSYDEAGRLAVEARAGLADAEPVDRQIASLVLNDGTWVEHALAKSKDLGELVARARRLQTTPEALDLIEQAARIDPTSRHVDEVFWVVLRRLGGPQAVIEIAGMHWIGQRRDAIVGLVTSRVSEAQSTSAT